MQWFYPLRRWAKDLLLWIAQSELQATQQGPAITLQLSGGARALIDEVDITDIIQGTTGDWGDGQGNAHHPGPLVILRRLSERYGELEIETNVRAPIELMTCQQGPHEDVDQALTRFDILYSRATTHAAVQMSPAFLAYILLSVRRVSPSRWPVLFMP